MAININAINAQSGQLQTYINQLCSAKAQLKNYMMSVSACWQGQEATYIVIGIEQTIAKIDGVIMQLEALSSDIKSAGAAIKREEDAAAAAARERALRQQRIQTAQKNYNKAVDECDDLYKEKERLEKMLKEHPFLKHSKNFKEKMEELTEKIEDAERKRSNCYNALSAARR